MEDVFAIQDDISQAIVKALRVILSEGEKKQIEKARAVDVKAYDYYLRGRQYFHHFRRKSLEYARQMFNKAIEIDPEYARAYAGVADCCSLLFTYFDARESNLRQADNASMRAIELEPELAEAHVARGIALSMSKRFDEAAPAFEQAMKLDPKLFDASYWFGRMRLTQGMYEESAKLFERASMLRPEDYQIPGFYAQVLTTLGRKDEALAAFRRDPDAFDLVLTDFNMPGLSGMDVALSMMSVRPSTLVALASGFLRPSEAEHARALGIQATLRKPYTLDELGAAVQRLLLARHRQT
jgi:tetratricopeptide (TPR) repeat protein